MNSATVYTALAAAIGAVLAPALSGCRYEVQTPRALVEAMPGLPPLLAVEEAVEERQRVALGHELALTQWGVRIDRELARREAARSLGLDLVSQASAGVAQVTSALPIPEPLRQSLGGLLALGGPAAIAAFGLKRPGDLTKKQVAEGYYSQDEFDARLAQAKLEWQAQA